MSKRTYEEYIKNDCHPVGYNEPCQSYYFAQSSVDLLLDKIDQLKQQLAEKDKEIAHLKEKDNYHLRYELAGADETITNLKQQLAEKQNTIDEINKEFVQSIHDWKALCAEKDKEIEDMDKDLVFNANEIKRLIQEKKRLKQNQTQLAIQELEKVKNFVDGRTYCANYINKRIQDLKGE